MLENENMKKQIEENENYVSIAAEMKAKKMFFWKADCNSIS